MKPCTTLDFYNYLNNKVHCAENLQFFLWLRDYTHRFNSPGQNLSGITIWTHSQQDDAIQKFHRQLPSTSKKILVSVTTKEVICDVFKGTDFSDDPMTRARGNSAFSGPASPTFNTNNDTALAGTIAPWESYEKKGSSESDDSRLLDTPMERIQSQEERDSATARAGYAKAGLHYPC